MQQIEKTESQSLPVFSTRAPKAATKQSGPNTFSKAYEAEEKQPKPDPVEAKATRARQPKDGLDAGSQSQASVLNDDASGPSKAPQSTTADDVGANPAFFMTSEIGLEPQPEDAAVPIEADSSISELSSETVIAEPTQPGLDVSAPKTVDQEKEVGLLLKSEQSLLPQEQKSDNDNNNAEQSRKTVSSGNQPGEIELQEPGDTRLPTKSSDVVYSATESDPIKQAPVSEPVETRKLAETGSFTRPDSAQAVTHLEGKLSPGLSAAQKADQMGGVSTAPASDLTAEPEVQIDLQRSDRRAPEPIEMPKLQGPQPAPSSALAASANNPLQPASVVEVMGQIGEVDQSVLSEQSAPRERAGFSGPGPAMGLQQSSPAARLVLGQFTAGLQKIDDGVIEIRLNPAELGRVTIQISEGVAGSVASVSADRPDVLELLRRNENLMSSEFENAGFAGMEFEFSDSEFDQQTGKGEGEHEFGHASPEMIVNIEQIDLAPSLTGQTDLDIRL